MVRSVIIFAFFAIATVLVIVMQPGPRPDYTYETPAPTLNEITRNEVQVLPEPQASTALSAPDAVITKLKAASKPAQHSGTTLDSGGSLKRLQAALDASLGSNTVETDATELVTSQPATPTPRPAPAVRQVATQAIAPELRDMSWQTLNTLNGLAHVNKAPGQEGSLLNSIVRRSMGHVDGSQVVQTSSSAAVTTPASTRDTTTPSAQSTRNSAEPDRNYVVASGDTLALIAIKLYGSALATTRLLADNPTLRQNPNALRIGQVLKFSAN